MHLKQFVKLLIKMVSKHSITLLKKKSFNLKKNLVILI